MNEHTPQPPNTFVVEQAQRIGEALHAGRLADAENIQAYMLAETDASGSAADRLARTTTAGMVFMQAVQAHRAGDEAQARTLMTTARDHVQDSAEWEAIVAGALVAVGRRDGWLPEEQYDLVHGIAAGNPATEALIAPIHRGHPATD